MTERQIQPPFRPDMTLAQAREVLEPLAEKGTDCPCCTQNVKVYARRLNAVAAKGLLALYEAHGTEMGHLPTVAQERLPGVNHQGGQLNLAAHWNLMQSERRRRPDGGRTGWWAVTDLGVQFLQGEYSVPEYARVFNGECLGLVGHLITVRDALGEDFSFSELMRATRPPSEIAETQPLFPTEEAA